MQRPIAFETFLSSATASSDFGTIFATIGFKTLEDLLLWYSLPWSCFRLSIAFPVHPSSIFQFEQHHWLHVPKVMGFHLCRNSIYLSTSNPSKLCLHLRFLFQVSKYLIHHMCFPFFVSTSIDSGFVMVFPVAKSPHRCKWGRLVQDSATKFQLALRPPSRPLTFNPREPRVRNRWVSFKGSSRWFKGEIQDFMFF